ncbi:MAG: TfoX/Sxy family protein [Pseudolabrys sp.]|jgi:DNA transformation protein
MDAEFVHDLFRDFGTVQIKRMFGGAGIFADGVMFGLIADDVIYLKTDDNTRPAFEREKSKPFQFAKKSGQVMVTSYWRVPDRLYDDGNELADWARAAHSVARAKSKRSAAPSRHKAKAATGRKPLRAASARKPGAKRN